jgi:nitroreductase
VSRTPFLVDSILTGLAHAESASKVSIRNSSAILSRVTTTFEEFGELVRSRRTHMLVDRGREVPVELIERLCELGAWAPCHKKTWPWKFAIVTGDGRARLGEAFAVDMHARDVGDEAKRVKTTTKYTRTPAVLVVGCEPHEHPTFHAENRDAVSAAVQNILLGATAAGLASFWSTPPIIDSPAALELCGFESDDRIVAVVYLGWPSSSVDAPNRPQPSITRVAR